MRRKGGTTGNGTTLEGLARAARALGLKAEGVQLDRDAIRGMQSPAIAWVDGSHYVALLAVDGERATIHDPNRGYEETLAVGELQRRTGGIFLRLSR